MFGLIGRIKAHPGQRGELADVLVQADGSMPGCLSYVVAEDPGDADLSRPENRPNPLGTSPSIPGFHL